MPGRNGSDGSNYRYEFNEQGCMYKKTLYKYGGFVEEVEPDCNLLPVPSDLQSE